MNRIWFFGLLLLTGCFTDRTSSGIDQPIIHELSLVKQKQRIAHLQKKLALAEKEKKKAEDEVSRLEEEVHEAELSLIRKQVANIEEQIRKLKNDPQKNMHLMQIEASSLFLKEREMLHQMIQTGPSPSAFEAQVVLDQILRVITDLSNRY